MQNALHIGFSRSGRKTRGVRWGALALAALFGPPSLATAATLTTLASFDPSTVGQAPYGPLIFNSAGSLYGMTNTHGTNGQGTVFKVDASNNYAMSVVVAFNTTNGAQPFGGLIADSSGNFFGTTFAGGTSSGGTAFKLDASNNYALTTLVNFAYNTTSPNEPRGNFGVDAAGNLYSTTVEGGPTAGASYGTIFKLSAGSYTNNQVAYFTSTTGIYPYGGVASDAAGNLYGTTQSGGGGQGSLFEVAANSGTVTKLVTFTGTANGANPHGPPIIGADGNLYGTTYDGGTNNQGTVYKYNLSTNTLTTLVNFVYTVGGGNPNPQLLMDAVGNLYGTTMFGGGSGNSGIAFKLDASNNYALTTLAGFNGNLNGSEPSAGMVADAAGNLYGTTVSAGASSAGTVYKITGTGFVSPGDFNLDGHIDVSDIAVMEQALTNLSAYEQSHGNLMDWQVKSLGDVNGDGKFNNADIQALITLIANNAANGGGQLTAVSEPATLILCVMGFGVLAIRRVGRMLAR